MALCQLLSSILAAPLSAPLLANADFEDGLRGWEITCAIERCGEVKSEWNGGSHAAVLRGSADEWTAVQLRQKLNRNSFKPPMSAAFIVSAAFSKTTDSWRAPLEAKISLVFEDEATGQIIGTCEEARAELPAAAEKLSVRCAPPTAAASTPRVAVSVVISFACVRSGGALMADNVDVRLDEEVNAAADPAPRAALAPAAVPRVLHFIFGLSSDFGGKPFGLVHHVVIRAALHSVQPTLAYFHHAHEPQGEWWEKTKPLLALRKVKTPTSIFGRTVRKFAHQADVLRLELLLQFGGLYMDMDVRTAWNCLCRLAIASAVWPLPLPMPLPPSAKSSAFLEFPIPPPHCSSHIPASPTPHQVLMLRPTYPTLFEQAAAARGGLLLAEEGIDGTIGAGNAMMISTRNSSVMHEWYGKYHGFSDSVWNGYVRAGGSILAVATKTLRQPRRSLLCQISLLCSLRSLLPCGRCSDESTARAPACQASRCAYQWSSRSLSLA